MNAISNLEFKRSTWQTAMMLTLGFWLSASLALDWVIMPSLYFAGMMNEANFSAAGYVIFGNFNRLELLSAGVVLTSVLAISKTKSNWPWRSIVLSGLLLTVALLDTYFLTPQMCALGTNLSFLPSNPVPATMNLLHGGYFGLEALKIVAGGMLLNWCWREAK
ncbi:MULTISPECIES: DUF4149 domain-containing protein [unclassified Anabaena]|uniref:DUF4149 domain-containing protein n=1 Tax=unclassified Anabaena TaxID=2619674 RepID=UPI0014469F67|nr:MULTISPECIES: DUF4149 domain-containing protein [unclassified Anabaena]MTJ10433.1 DUF4149 domain-containing protein [Anabaena sp. UHCC 0204]MTJ55357.1 DUF4149 domain-containing protein [Anabaena sp. UHCC 0253]